MSLQTILLKPIGLIGLIATAVLLALPAQAGNRCDGFRVIRDRNDYEAPILPRRSIAARAIQSPDGCAQSPDRTSANQTLEGNQTCTEEECRQPDAANPVPPSPTPHPAN